MRPTSDPSARELLALIRSSLWQKPLEPGFLPGFEDWSKIAAMAIQQTVGPLAFEEALNLPKNVAPPKEWRQNALKFLETNRRTHLLVDGCLAEVVRRFREVGIDCVLLKGQAYARAYVRPELRQCGDIDLLVGDDNFREAYETVRAFGWKSEEVFNPKAKHFGCELRGVRIEFHRKVAQLSTSYADHRFMAWSLSQVTLSGGQLSAVTAPAANISCIKGDGSNIGGNGRKISISGEEIRLPTPLFDIVFVFLHMYHHFIDGGIGLRHVSDLAMLLHAHSKTIDHIELKRKLKEFNLMRGWKLFASICVEHLGLPETECPFYSKSCSRQGDKLLEIIMKEGNFGRARTHKSMRPEGFLAGKFYSLQQITVNHISKVRIDPAVCIRSYFRYLFAGTANFIKEIMKSRGK